MDKVEMIKLMKNSLLAKDNPIILKKIDEWADKDPWDNINCRDDSFEEEFRQRFYIYESDTIEFCTIALSL